jgi:cadmium resistance transport/sequestration family protein
MSNLLTAIPTGFLAFTATNLDDLVILTLLFSQVNGSFRRRHIFIGQYLGFTVLILASIFGFLGGMVLPSHWIGLLGLVPITLGLNQWLNQDHDFSEEDNEETNKSDNSRFSSFISPQSCSVAAITIANGGDNVGIYMPLFASSKIDELLVILVVFLLMVGVWCQISYLLTRQPAIAEILTRYGNSFVPFVLIGLGVFIILESQAMTPLALVASCLCLMGIIKTHKPSPEMENNEVMLLDKS